MCRELWVCHLADNQRVSQTPCPLRIPAGYLNMGISAGASLPAPIGGVLASSYKQAVPVVVARARASHAASPKSVQASISSLL